jgi:hypothetical protein
MTGMVVARQVQDTCLVHALVNATQRHDALDEMLSEVHTSAQAEDMSRRDVTAGAVTARRVLGVAVRCGFDFERDAVGIAHLHTPCGTGHFVALRRAGGSLFVLDSLDG